MSSKADIQGMLIRLTESGLKQTKDSDVSDDAYFEALRDISTDLLDAAATMYIASETWFPTPGDIRTEANKLKMSTLRVPNGAEAWAQVLGAIKWHEAVSCKEGAVLYRDAVSGKTGEDYVRAIRAYDDHLKKLCGTCTKGGYVEEYDHPAVKETVRLFGGRDALFTEYRTADRARFIDAYKEVLERETYLITMPESVAGYLETKREERQLETGEGIKKLTAKLSRS